LGSTNGTFVSGAKILEQALPMDTVIRAGNKTFVFKVVAESVAE
jgi:pSer/pThr/pTyr-binding forkhead associated (FHA) protein